MDSVILCGFSMEESEKIIAEMYDIYGKGKGDFSARLVCGRIFRSDEVVFHITGSKGAYIEKGTADRMIAKNFRAAVKNIDWLKYRGKIEIRDKKDQDIYGKYINKSESDITY